MLDLVDDFGADPTGTIDSTAAITAWFAALKASGQVGRWPAGQYLAPGLGWQVDSDEYLLLSAQPPAAGVPGAGDELTEWIDADGIAHPIAVQWDRGRRGAIAPPIRSVVDPAVGGPGGVRRHTEHDTVRILLPILLGPYESPGDLEDAIANLVRAMDPKRGDGRLRVTGAVTGEKREQIGQIVAGLEGDETLGDQHWWDHIRFVLTFEAPDPYWHAIADTTQDFTLQQSGMFFPGSNPNGSLITLADASVYGGGTIANVGDVEAWPLWTVTGPFSRVVLISDTLEKRIDLTINPPLGPNETLTIDTRPRRKFITRSDGSNLMAGLRPLSVMWPLQPGSNTIRIEHEGATLSSNVRATFRPRYLTRPR